MNLNDLLKTKAAQNPINRERLAVASQLAVTGSYVAADAQHSGVTAIVTPKPSTDEERLNKTERAYLAYIRRLNYLWIGIQNITFKIADDCRFTPDFSVIDQDGKLVLTDVKGFQREDAFIKIKVAARLFPWANFQLAFKNRGNAAGFRVELIKP